jgi:predicted DNA-binding transcriptional regulator AlpA
MKTFEFSIVASGLDPEAEDFADRFYEAGCDDATISFQKGHIILDFARDAGAVDAAICSAIECVEKAGAHVDRVEPDPLVNLSDIASRTGLTRQAISHYSKGNRGAHFPAPVARVTSDAPLWDWASVAKWLYENDKLARDAAIEAEAVRVANVAIETGTPKLEALQSHLQAYDAGLRKAA